MTMISQKKKSEKDCEIDTLCKRQERRTEMTSFRLLKQKFPEICVRRNSSTYVSRSIIRNQTASQTHKCSLHNQIFSSCSYKCNLMYNSLINALVYGNIDQGIHQGERSIFFLDRLSLNYKIWTMDVWLNFILSFLHCVSLRKVFWINYQINRIMTCKK